LVLFRSEHATEHGASAKQVEPRRGYLRAAQALGKRAGGVVKIGSHFERGGRNDVVAVAELGIIRRGDDDAVQTELPITHTKDHKTVRLAYARRMQEETVHDGKDGSVGAKPEGEGEDWDDRETGITTQLAQPVAHVLYDGFEKEGGALLMAGFRGFGRGAKGYAGAALGRGAGETGALKVIGMALDMRAKFLVQVSVESRAPEQKSSRR